ncbi:hypothetical protein ACSBR2_038370 [Camellia fascicularis]
MRCMCRWFEFKGIMCAHTITVLLERCIYHVPDKCIVSRWRKDIERGYTCIPTTYTKARAVVNAKLHDKYHKMLDEILEIAANDNGKHEVLDLGLIEIKDRVRKDQSSSASHVPPSTSNAPPSTRCAIQYLSRPGDANCTLLFSLHRWHATEYVCTGMV